MDVKLKQQSPASKKEKSKKLKNQKAWLGSYLVIAAICIAVYFLVRLEVFYMNDKTRQLIQNVSLAGFFAIVILSAAKFIEMIILKKSHTKSVRYNLVRLIHLLSILAIGFLFISFLFANWYAAAVSLGLFSLILGFALQTPISSFIGWIYLIIRNPYRIGDRIQIGEFKGDVVEISYLDTTLWEFAGDYLTNDLPSGRLIRFPNTLVFQSAVFNYSWRNFAYIWNEIPIHIAYESDLDYLEKTIKKVTKEELGEEIAEKIKDLKELISQTPVDEIDIKEYPFVSFRINNNTWVEVTVTYLVPPKQAATIRSRIIKRILNELLKEPEKALFPKSNAR
jgi:small-conductance mechanosensitive channel